MCFARRNVVISESDIQAQGLYVHTHSNNGQGKCSIISRYPFSGITPNKYGAYIDLGEGIVVLVMNCHGAYFPYGPYQLNGIEYKDFPATDDVDYVVKVNKEARRGHGGQTAGRLPFVYYSFLFVFRGLQRTVMA